MKLKNKKVSRFAKSPKMNTVLSGNIMFMGGENNFRFCEHGTSSCHSPKAQIFITDMVITIIVIILVTIIVKASPPSLSSPSSSWIQSTSTADKPVVSLRLGPTLDASLIKEGDDVYFDCRWLIFVMFVSFPYFSSSKTMSSPFILTSGGWYVINVRSICI